MSNNAIAILEQKLQQIDVTKLVEYTKKIQDIGSLNNMMAPQYLKDFIMAQDYTSSMLSQAVRFELDAKSALKTAEAIAYLDRAGDYLKSKGIKDTAESRKKYVPIDPDVQRAEALEAKATALVTFLKNKYFSFRQAHDDVKKMVYSDQYMTPEEGM